MQAGKNITRFAYAADRGAISGANPPSQNQKLMFADLMIGAHFSSSEAVNALS